MRITERLFSIAMVFLASTRIARYTHCSITPGRTSPQRLQVLGVSRVIAVDPKEHLPHDAIYQERPCR